MKRDALTRRGLFQGIFALAASGVVAKAVECLPIARAAIAPVWRDLRFVWRGVPAPGTMTLLARGPSTCVFLPSIRQYAPVQAPIAVEDDSRAVPDPQNAS